MQLLSSSGVMFAMFQASMKFSQCGWAVNWIPSGMEPCGCNAAESMLKNGSTQKRTVRASIAVPVMRTALDCCMVTAPFH